MFLTIIYLFVIELLVLVYFLMAFELFSPLTRLFRILLTVLPLRLGSTILVLAGMFKLLGLIFYFSFSLVFDKTRPTLYLFLLVLFYFYCFWGSTLSLVADLATFYLAVSDELEELLIKLDVCLEVDRMVPFNKATFLSLLLDGLLPLILLGFIISNYKSNSN